MTAQNSMSSALTGDLRASGPSTAASGTSRTARKRLHVAVYMHDLAGGGVERQTLTLLPLLREQGIDITLLLHSREGDLQSMLSPDLEVISFETSRTIADVLPLRRYMLDARPDVLMAHLNHNNIAAMLARLTISVPTRLYICQHNALSSEARGEWKYKVVPWFYRHLAPVAAGWVSVSAGVADDLSQTCGIPRERVSVIYNPVIDASFAGRVAEDDHHRWLGDGKGPVFVTVGRLVEQKDHGTLLEALAIVRREKPARLLILGTGPLREAIEAQARALGIADAVDFLGFRKNPLPLVRQSDALILSSRYEGFGNVVAEALGCGTPVVSTDCPYGPSEILDDGRYGALVPVGDAQALAREMATDLRQRWPSDVLKRRAQVFSAPVSVANYLRLLHEGTGAATA